MNMPERIFRRVASELFEAIDLLVQHQLILPAAAMTYVGIDTMASLNRVASKENVTRDDFKAWVNLYILPEASLQCNAADLYSARCGLLHTYSAESSSTRDGSARQIMYAFDLLTAAESNEIAQQLGLDSKYVTIHVPALVDLFKSGVEKFWNDLSSDAAKLALVNKRAGGFYALISEVPRLASPMES